MYVTADACMSTAIEKTPVNKKRPIQESIANLFEMLTKARALSDDIRVTLDDDCGPDPKTIGPESDGSCMVDSLNDLEAFARNIIDNLLLINEIIKG